MGIIILNKKSTFPKQWIDFLEENKTTYINYKSKQNEITQSIEEQKRTGTYDIFSTVNTYYNQVKMLKKNFKKILLNSNDLLECYHATRITKEERLFIKEKGLMPFNKQTVVKKFQMLFDYGYITEEEKNKLIIYNRYHNEDVRENRICFYSGYVDYNIEDNKNGVQDCLENYGGEFIYTIPELKDICENLKAYSDPCIIKTFVKFQTIEEESFCSLISNIFDFYYFDKLHLIQVQLGVKNKIIPVTDIMVLQEKG